MDGWDSFYELFKHENMIDLLLQPLHTWIFRYGIDLTGQQILRTQVNEESHLSVLDQHPQLATATLLKISGEVQTQGRTITLAQREENVFLARELIDRIVSGLERCLVG